MQAAIHEQYAQIKRLELTTHGKHARMERLRAEVPWPPLEAFHFFPQLPVELRRMISKYALRRLVRALNVYKSFDTRAYNRVYRLSSDGSKIARADGLLACANVVQLPLLCFFLLSGVSWNCTSCMNLITKRIPHAELAQSRANFRPGQDTVYLSSETDDVIRFLGLAL